jgi:hypothetical protein
MTDLIKSLLINESRQAAVKLVIRQMEAASVVVKGILNKGGK